jgi:hypothetical protein
VAGRLPKVPVVLCIDVEPDGASAPDPGDPPPYRGFELMDDLLSELRPELERLTGRPATFSWYVRADPSIERVYGSAAWPYRQYGDRFARLAGRGDLFGIHPHTLRWQEDGGGWLAEYADEDWIGHCVRVSSSLYVEHFGRPSRLHRSGDRLLTNDMVALLEQLGVRMDMSAEPGEPERGPFQEGLAFAGTLPDCTTTPRMPFRPDHSDFLRPGRMGRRRNFWMMPLTCVEEDESGRAVPGSTMPVAPSRLWRAADWLPRPRHRVLALWKHWDTPEAFWSSALETSSELPRPHIVLAVRSDETVRPASGVSFTQIMKHLLEDPDVTDRVYFTDPERALKQLVGPARFLP